MSKVIVYHEYYDCDTGCCGHIVQLDDRVGDFEFKHPYGQDPLEFARKMVALVYGPEHVADLDWERCVISE